MFRRFKGLLVFVSSLAWIGCGEDPFPPTMEEMEPSQLYEEAVSCANSSPLKRAFFGDLHVHTSLSADAYSFGTRNDPSKAYAFAKGQSLTLAGGATTKIDRPLDFTAVTDHGEFLLGTWTNIGLAADDANAPCTFTAFRGYEYTQSINGANEHRNVIFKNSIVPATIYGSRDYPRPQDLWAALESGCTDVYGCDVITIPHNSNQSLGKKFIVESHSAAVAARRAEIEVLAEIFQGKGNSECLNTGDPSDQGYDAQCDFEILPETADPSYKPGYVRSGLGNGLLYYAQHGINPVQTGFIGSTDTHNATSGGVAEYAWQGNHGTNDSTPAARLTKVINKNPGGLAVVWAEQNTRASIFAALKRRETYSTSGPRMLVRFYQTWSTSDLCADPSFPAQAEANGVPMGGVMPATGAVRYPRFVVYAAKDKTNIASIDIIKAQVVNGVVKERIVTLPATNTTLGDATMCRTVTDTQYDPANPAFYYARVLEKPTWRWSHYDCQRDPARCQRDEQIQERAWTSPIWNMP